MVKLDNPQEKIELVKHKKLARFKMKEISENQLITRMIPEYNEQMNKLVQGNIEIKK